MCSPSPVARRAWADDRARYGSRVRYLGIKGDDAHAKRRSDHNCGQYAGYHPGYAHALDTGVDSPALGYEIVRARLADPRVKYCIFRGVGYYPHHRGGGTFASSGHPDHVHTSFMPGTTFDTSPFYTGDEFDMASLDDLKAVLGEWEKDTRVFLKDAVDEAAQRVAAHDTATDKSVKQAILDRLDEIEAKVDALS